jgi:spoIIIJ-associated protein
MSENRTSLEIIAPSIEEAIAQGLADLGLTEDAVDVEVLDSGSKGLFGLGSRQARVRLTIKSADLTEAPITSLEVRSEPPSSENEDAVTELTEEDADLEENEQVETLEVTQSPASAVPADITLHVAHETVLELLERMKIQAEVSARFVDEEEARGRETLRVEIEGKDLSILIGPHAETLNALQYIASLIIGKELGHSISLVVDVQGYRKRRSQQIRQLAQRMADQVTKTGRSMALEPMPASERRLVHIELRNHPQVTTESVGEEPRRKVTIIPKA